MTTAHLPVPATVLDPEVLPELRTTHEGKPVEVSWQPRGYWAIELGTGPGSQWLYVWRRADPARLVDDEACTCNCGCECATIDEPQRFVLGEFEAHCSSLPLARAAVALVGEYLAAFPAAPLLHSRLRAAYELNAQLAKIEQLKPELHRLQRQVFALRLTDPRERAMALELASSFPGDLADFTALIEGALQP